MPKHPRVQAVSSRDGRGANSAKSTSTCDLPPIQFIIHADPESICKCCGGTNNEQNRMQDLEAFCRRCCDKLQDGPQNQESRKSSLRPNDTQVDNYPTSEDFSMQTDECQTHFHKHLYNASLLQKYCGGNIFGPMDMEDEARSDSADEMVVEEATDGTQTDESEFPRVKLVRLLSDAETQTNESILSQLKSPLAASHHTMKQVNTSLTMIRSQNPFLYNFNESNSIDDILQPFCQCQSAPTSRHASASPSMTQTPQSLSTIYQLPPEEKKPKSDNQTFMGCFKRKKSKDKPKNP